MARRLFVAARSHQGQALPLILVFLIVLCVGALITFNTGQVVNKKVELTNTADAAAYSVAVEQARAWNLAAYLNRGRVANEVAIAQAVSLNSWLTQINVSAHNFKQVARVLSAIPVIGPAFAAVAQAFEAADQALRGIRTGVRTGSQGLIGGLDTANAAYATAAYGVVEALSTASSVQTARDVVAENSPRADMRAIATTALTAQLLSARTTYLDAFDVPSSSGRGARRTSVGGERYRNVVMESRDVFTRNRKDDWRVLDANGGTDLVEYDRWAAVDVNEIDFSYGLDAFKIPVGWGGAQALGNTSQPRFYPGIRTRGRNGWYSDYSRRRFRPYNGVSRYGIAGRKVEADPGGRLVGDSKRDAYFSTYRNGIAHRYHDVQRGRAETPEDGPVFTVEVQTGMGDARTTTALGVGSGRMAMREQPRGNHMRAVASAQVYFNRPHQYAAFRRIVWGRRDNRFEAGSLFSPYWQARLVDTPPALQTSFAAAP
ncbi:pilus assembly protein TadG-related protein [Lysobacter korlensis]|uniref:Pilus assembly protein TadG-related protein n=1 Tax=Lysobacter korlensis TaxID=553636 RepID=A0ABV6RHU8_9GAMM